MTRKKSGTFDNKTYQNEYHKKMLTKLITFNPANSKDMKVWNYLQTAENKSALIKDALLEKMEKENTEETNNDENKVSQMTL